MHRATCARGVVEYRGRYLLVKHKVSKVDFWCLPGGKVEEGEDILTALTREMIEETGVKPVIGNLLFVHQMKNEKGAWGHPDFIFHIKNGKDYLNIDISKTSHGEIELLDIGFKNIEDLFVLPEFLKTDLPKLKKLDFIAPAQIKLDTFII